MLLDALNDGVLMQKVHLMLGGVDVHIDVLRGDLYAKGEKVAI